MKILSLFDGMSVTQQALKNIGADVEVYYASEIDEYAKAVTQSNFPNTTQIGDVSKVKPWMSDQFDLLIGGSPCQDLSIAKKGREGLSGSRSGLFWEYVRIRDVFKPKYFILENVASMPKEAKDTISEALGVQPIMINASLVSAQNRKRLFWVGRLDEFGTYKQVEISQPEDRGILLKDILETKDFNGLYSDYNNSTTYDKARTLGTGCGVTRSATCQQVITSPVRIAKIGKGGQGDRVYSIEGKSVNLSANGGGRGAKTGLYAVKDFVRKLTPTECLRLQSMPDNYFDKAEYKGKPISNTQRYKMCGNAFNCEVIVHILKHLFK